MRQTRFLRLLVVTLQILTLILIQLPNSRPIVAVSGFTVTYDGNGSTTGEVPIDATLYFEGDEISIFDNTLGLQKNGLVFVGWTQVVDSNEVIKPGDKLTMESTDIVLFAKWEPAIIVSYSFDNQLTDDFNNSVLTPFETTTDGYSRNNATSGFGNDDDGSYWFWTSTLSRGGGFKIDIDQDISASYTIGVRFAFNSTGSGYRKIIDYKNSASDTGFYFLGGRLNFYPFGTGTTNVASNQVVDIIATRKSDGLFTAYFVIDGTLYKELELNAGNEAIPSIVDGKVRFGFFFDDLATSSEATSGGKVYSIRVWNGPISSVQAQTAMEPTYTVSFDTDTDTSIATQTIKKDEMVTKPEDPIKVGHTFLGWYYNVGHGWMLYDFDAPVTKNTELRALWEINQYAVRFVDYNDELILESLINHSSDAVAPSGPSREGWTFNGWNSSLTTITSPRTIKATYKSIVQTIIENDDENGLAVESPNLIEAVLFDEDDLDEQVRIKLSVNLLKFQELTEAEIDLFEEYYTTLGVGLSFTLLLMDISVFKEIGDTISSIEQTFKPLAIKIKVPEFLQGKEFTLVRIHLGVLEELDYLLDEETNTITFSSDKFSTYALVLGEESPLPDTNDQKLFIGTYLLAGLILLMLSRKNVSKFN